MTPDEWRIFAARVRAGCLTRYNGFVTYGFEEDQGILIENKPYASHEVEKSKYGDSGDNSTRLRWQPFFHWISPFPKRAKAQDLEYFIDGVWRSYQEIMS